MLAQVDISEDLIGQTYGELFARLTLTQHLIPLGLYRRCATRRCYCICSLHSLADLLPANKCPGVTPSIQVYLTSSILLTVQLYL